jgi:hypothetical protein
MVLLEQRWRAECSECIGEANSVCSVRWRYVVNGGVVVYRKQKSREWWALLASGVGSLRLGCRALDAERAACAGADPGKLD